MHQVPVRERASRQPRVLAAWTVGMLAAAEQAGLSSKELLLSAGLSATELEDRDAPVDFQRHLHMVHEIIRLQPGVATGLRTGMTATTARFGVLGYVLRYARVLRRALDDYIRFQRLVTDVTTWFVAAGPLYRLNLTLHRQLDAVPSAAEAQVATLIAVSRQLTGVQIIPRRVLFQHRPQSDPREHNQFFGCSVEFGAERTELLLDTSTMELPIDGAQELSYQHFRSYVESSLSKETGLQPTSEAVRQYILEQLKHGPPRRDAIARALGKSVRTLLRHLELEGQTFETLLDSCRRELALAYAADSRLASFEIAGLLGYTEPSAFFRAFRRWTGESPQQHRRQLQGST